MKKYEYEFLDRNYLIFPKIRISFVRRDPIELSECGNS